MPKKIENMSSDILYLVYQHLENKITEIKKEISYRTGSEEESQIMDEINKLTEFNTTLFDLYENRLDDENKFKHGSPKFKEGDIVKHSYSKYKVVKVQKDYDNLAYTYDLEILGKSSSWRCPPFIRRCRDIYLKEI